MLNKPKFMKPSTNKEECTIDLTADKIPFSCIVDGNESITKWQIKIYDITNNEEVFKTEEITLESSFYPVDEKNRNVVFSVDIKEYIPEDNTAFINREDAYYWTITFVGSSGYSVTSYQEVFYANKTPNIKFSYNGNDVDLTSEEILTLTSKECTFKAVLDFEGSDHKAQLKRYGWRITDSDNGQVLVDTITKNQIYGSADNIICSYDGFLNGGNYSVEVYVETQNNTKVVSSFNLSVSYITTFLGGDFRVRTLKNEPAIMLDWEEALVIAGFLKNKSGDTVKVEDTTFRSNYPVDTQCSIEIPDGFKVVYDEDKSLNFDVDENSYIAFSTQLLSGDNTTKTVFSAEGNITIGRDGAGDEIKRELLYDNSSGEFSYIVSRSSEVVASTKYPVENKPSEYVWYNIFMSPLIKNEDGDYSVELNVYESKIENCIYPSEELYPMAETAWTEAGSAGFYPILGIWTNLKKTVSNGAEVEV